MGEKEEEEEKKPKKKTVYEWEQVNTQKAIWLRAKEDVTEEEYNEFYKGFSKDYLDPLAYTHFNAEGEIEFKSILCLAVVLALVKGMGSIMLRFIIDSNLSLIKESLSGTRVLKLPGSSSVSLNDDFNCSGTFRPISRTRSGSFFRDCFAFHFNSCNCSILDNRLFILLACKISFSLAFLSLSFFKAI